MHQPCASKMFRRNRQLRDTGPSHAVAEIVSLSWTKPVDSTTGTVAGGPEPVITSTPLTAGFSPFRWKLSVTVATRPAATLRPVRPIRLSRPLTTRVTGTFWPFAT
jgi:hypothetical protein